MMAVRARRHTQDPGPRLQAVTSEPFLILVATGSLLSWVLGYSAGTRSAVPSSAMALGVV